MKKKERIKWSKKLFKIVPSEPKNEVF